MAQAIAAAAVCEVCDSDAVRRLEDGRLLCPLCAATDRLGTHCVACPACRTKDACLVAGWLLVLWSWARRETRR